MSDDERIADIAQTIAEATLELSPTATTSTEPPTVTGITIASDDERKPTPAPAPPTKKGVGARRQRMAGVAEDVLAGNPVWIPKREIPASEFDAVAAVATNYNIKLIDANLSYYQVVSA